MQYFFVLGTNHSLSKIDIVNTLSQQGVDFSIVEASEEALVVEVSEIVRARVRVRVNEETKTDEEWVKKLMGELGSAAKVGVIYKSYPLAKFPENFLAEVGGEEFKQFFYKNIAGVEQIRFGISTYGAGGKFKDLNEVFYRVPSLARGIKERLGDLRGMREVGINYLSTKERELSTVAVDQNGLLTDGFELVFGVGKEEVFVGKTLVVQDYEGYSLRDYGRPARDAKSGMIPPKLAKMMVNLTGKDKDSLMLDPFCGSGTILQEMILLGYKNIIGTDSSEKSINDTKLNLNWLESKFRFKETKIKLLKADVRKLSSVISFKTVDAIVTEPYLGSPKAKYFNPQQIKEEIRKLEDLYLAAFNEFRKVLRDSGTIAMIFPVFRFQDQFFHLEILEKIKALGFAPGNLLLTEPKGKEKLKLNLTERGGVIFFRPGQTVSREIFAFEKTT